MATAPAPLTFPCDLLTEDGPEADRFHNRLNAEFPDQRFEVSTGYQDARRVFVFFDLYLDYSHVSGTLTAGVDESAQGLFARLIGEFQSAIDDAERSERRSRWAAESDAAEAGWLAEHGNFLS